MKEQVEAEVPFATGFEIGDIIEVNGEKYVVTNVEAPKIRKFGEFTLKLKRFEKQEKKKVE